MQKLLNDYYLIIVKLSNNYLIIVKKLTDQRDKDHEKLCVRVIKSNDKSPQCDT